MGLFGKKKPAEPENMAGEELAPPSDMPAYDTSNIPVDSVLTLRQQGLTNDQIVQSLQRDGYTSDQIFEAINQADIKGNVEQMPPGEMEQMAPLENPMPDEYGYEQGYDQGYGQQQQGPPPMGAAGPAPKGDRMEEVAEAIINEKWEDLTKDIGKVAEWKEKIDTRLIKIEQSIEDLNNNYDKLHQALIGKISEYDKNILNVGTEIKAMEKVFQKMLPTFTENVNELSRITRGVKKKKA